MAKLQSVFKWLKAGDQLNLEKQAVKASDALVQRYPDIGQTAYSLFHPSVLRNMGADVERGSSIVWMKPSDLLDLAGDKTGLTATDRLKYQQQLIARPGLGQGLTEPISITGRPFEGRYEVGNISGLNAAKVAAEAFPDKPVPVVIKSNLPGKPLVPDDLGSFRYKGRASSKFSVPGRAPPAATGRGKVTTANLWRMQGSNTSEIQDNLRTMMSPESQSWWGGIDVRRPLSEYGGWDPIAQADQLAKARGGQRDINPLEAQMAIQQRIDAARGVIDKITEHYGADALKPYLSSDNALTFRMLGVDDPKLANVPLPISRVESFATWGPEGQMDVPSLFRSKETGSHMGELATAAAFDGRNSDARLMEDTRKRLASEKDPVKRATLKADLEHWRSTLNDMKSKVTAATPTGMPKDFWDTVMGVVADLDSEWESTKVPFRRKNWQQAGAAGVKALQEKVAAKFGRSPDEFGAFSERLYNYYRTATGRQSETRFFLPQFKKPVLIFDTMDNNPSNIAAQMAAMPVFAKHRDRLEAIADMAMSKHDNLKTVDELGKELFDIAGEYGYDSFAYMNQGEGAAHGARSMSVIVRDPKKLVSLRDKFPKVADEYKLASVAGILAPFKDNQPVEEKK